ncbi:MAG: hypothetical protein IKF80_02365 [Erysipelotrichaceae bacterium]|nr:hypothetical protein [Erysipelotrichaceae bacterium]
MYYSLNESLKPYERSEELSGPFVSIINSSRWQELSQSLDPECDIEGIEENYGKLTKAIFDHDSIRGTFLVPDTDNTEHFFGFFLDKQRVVFIDDGNFVSSILKSMSRKKSSFSTSTFRFLYDFMDDLTEDDIDFFTKLETELDAMENELSRKVQISSVRLAEIRSIIRKYMICYEQLENVLSEMIENENGLFDQELIQYLMFYLDRVKRLYDFASNIREYSQEIRDLRKDMIDMRQNDVNTAIAVVTTIFLPLNLIAGWYGMNFRNMPELQWHYSYYVIIAISLTIVIVMLIYFKKKKWFQ